MRSILDIFISLFLYFFLLCHRLPFGVFHDVFWSLKSEHPEKVVVSCPDVMFNIYSRDIADERYATLAGKWHVKKWVESNGRVRWYGCKGNYAHDREDSCTFNSGIGVPPCDLENLADAIKFVMKECEDAGLFCELQEGTLLGTFLSLTCCLDELLLCIKCRLKNEVILFEGRSVLSDQDCSQTLQ